MQKFPDPLEFLTFKSGKFHFYSEYDVYKINLLITEVKILFNILKYMPSSPDVINSLKHDFIKKSIFGTAAIEGNPFNEDDVDRILNNSFVCNLHNLNKSKQEILNLKKLYEKLETNTTNSILISEEQIKNYHYIITNNLEYNENTPGSYRNTKVIVGDENHGGVYKPPVILVDIINLMKKYIEFINSDSMLEIDCLLRSAYAHYYLAMIHPFRDGNGRTSRFVEAWILNKCGYQILAPMLSNYYYNNIDKYYSVFSDTRKQKNMTIFFMFFLEACIYSLKYIITNINIFLYKVVFTDYIAKLTEAKFISPRQKLLLENMFDNKQAVSPQILYNNIKYKALYSSLSVETARKDLKKLFDIGILEKTDKNMYTINIGFFTKK